MGNELQIAGAVLIRVASLATNDPPPYLPVLASESATQPPRGALLLSVEQAVGWPVQEVPWPGHTVHRECLR